MEGVEFAELPFVPPATSEPHRLPAPREQTAQERELWQHANEADFGMDVAGEDERRERERFNEALDTFGILNPAAMASALGFQIGETDAAATSTHSGLLGLSVNAEEDAFLADLLENTGET